MNRLTLLRGVSAGGGAALLPLRARAADTVRVISFPVDTGLETLYSQSSGISDQSGLLLQTQMVSFGALSQSAIASGTADIGNSTVGSLAVAREKGLPLVIVASGGLYTTKEPTSVLMVPKDSPAVTARDLNGKILACNGLSSISQFAVEEWMDKNGGDAKTVHWIDMPFSEMPLALAAHRIDAALVAEPQATMAKDGSRTFAKAYDAVADHFMISIWVATASWVSANTDVARRFAAMVYKTATWANAHRAQTGDVLAKTTHLDPGLIRTMNRVTFAESNQPGLVKPQLDMALRYGAITKPVAPEELFAPELRR